MGAGSGIGGGGVCCSPASSIDMSLAPGERPPSDSVSIPCHGLWSPLRADERARAGLVTEPEESVCWASSSRRILRCSSLT
jgi:hypothetical protein